MSSLRVYVGAENLVTWDHLGDLPIDPEKIDGYSMWNTTNYNTVVQEPVSLLLKVIIRSSIEFLKTRKMKHLKYLYTS